MAALLPARPVIAADGTPRSETHDDVYHSADGGPGQARHVFLAGNDLPARWAGRDRFVILENGFGTGLNFLVTWAAWAATRASRPANARLHYLATEKHPIRRDDLAALHVLWPELATQSAALRADWPVPMPGFHRLEFAADGVILTLMLGDAADCLRQLRAEVDAFHLDGFDPRKNPDMWSPALFGRCAQLAAPDATLATWCVAGPVRAALSAAGFAVEKAPGYGRKREMLRGRLARPHAAPALSGRPTHAREAVILGAGLAGCAGAERLAARGWRVRVFDRHAGPAGEASGNLAGIVRPLLSRDDNRASRLNRACFLHAARAWNQLERAGLAPLRGLDGVLQIARDDDHEALLRAIAAEHGLPDDYARALDPDQAGAWLGTPVARAGCLYPGGGWANPPSLCQAWLDAGGARIHLSGNTVVAGIERAGDGWRLVGADGATLAETATLILATGASARLLAPAAELPIAAIRGQVSHLPAGSLPAFGHALCREGYLTPAVDGIHCLGATYARDGDPECRLADHAENLERLEQMLPGAGADLAAARLAGRVGFRAAAPDRLPLVGALPDPAAQLTRAARLAELPRLPGLHGLLGYASRGLVWAALAAETLASQLDGEPMPLEADLLDSLDPGRFRLRAHRRGR